MARGHRNNNIPKPTPLEEVVTGTLWEAGGCEEAQDEYLLSVGVFNDAISEIPDQYRKTAFIRIRVNGEGPAYAEVGYRK